MSEVEVPDEVLEEASTVSLGGRIFQVSKKITLRQRTHIAALMSRARMDDVEQMIRPGADMVAIACAIVNKAEEAGILYDLLAATLIERGKVFNKDDAKTNAQFFGDLSDEKECALLEGAIVSVLLAFFVGGLERSRTSLMSLVDSETSPDLSKKLPPDSEKSSGMREGPTTSENSTISSES